MRATTLFALPLLAALTMTVPTAAADLEVVEPVSQETFEKRWHAAAGLYLWGAGLSGDVGVAGIGPANVDLSFFDILEDLDIAIMGVAEFRYDRFGVFADLFYTQTTAEQTVLRGYADAEVTTSIFAGTLMGEYRAWSEGRSSIDAMAGVRVWNVEGELDLRTIRGRRFDRSTSHTWVDPMIGVKSRIQGDMPLYLTSWAMIGGFGASSDIDWDVMGAIGYEITSYASLLAGYRAVGVDYTNDGFEFNTTLHGPFVSAIFRF